ncbi:hypothetical protein DFH07DRAFT_959684 [Mycena maculata]|uniref:Uncharacterized protein n=1 Tax=Mycena maculata TaxID=230809 RepID=A0AAD7NCN5_9AGAR|nr:hypothetical protein DFH07DRAFT_959684 [Mycena maculata]
MPSLYGCPSKSSLDPRNKRLAYPAWEPGEHNYPYCPWTVHVFDTVVEDARLRQAFQHKYPEDDDPATGLFISLERVNCSDAFQQDLRFLLAKIAACEGVFSIKEHIRERDEAEAQIFLDTVLSLQLDSFLEAWGIDIPPAVPGPPLWGFRNDSWGAGTGWDDEGASGTSGVGWGSGWGNAWADSWANADIQPFAMAGDLPVAGAMQQSLTLLSLHGCPHGAGTGNPGHYGMAIAAVRWEDPARPRAPGMVVPTSK